MSNEKIRVGIVGAWRGMSFAQYAEATGMDLVAVCDTREDRLAAAGQRTGAATYTDYERMLEHDLDAAACQLRVHLLAHADCHIRRDP